MKNIIWKNDSGDTLVTNFPPDFKGNSRDFLNDLIARQESAFAGWTLMAFDQEINQ